MSRAKSIGRFLWKYLFGVLLCQSALTAVIALGWTLRVMQRSTLITWMGKEQLPESHIRWPNWLRGQRTFFRNIQQGFTGILNVWVLTLPGCMLWWFSWFAGWNNSFHKGYELAWVGPVTGLIGIALFILAMFYLPMAQARQAVTGEWKRFYEYRTVRKIIRRQWFPCFCLAALYALLNVPIMLLKTGPFFFAQGNPGLADLTLLEAKKWLGDYYFAASLIVFPLFILLRVIAARIYARGVQTLYQEKKLVDHELSDFERNVLEKLQLPIKQSPHVVLSTAAHIARVATGAAMAAVWFIFAAQIYVAQFLLYHPGQGWINQPAVHLPWFKYLPKHLQGDLKKTPPPAEP